MPAITKGAIQTTGCDQGDNPVRQVGNFRVGKYHDITVNFYHLITSPAKFRFLVFQARTVVLNSTVAVLVFKGQQTGLFPVLEPLRAFFVDQVAVSCTDFTHLDGVHQVQAGHSTYRRSGGIEDGDEYQRPTHGRTGVLYLGHSEKPGDDIKIGIYLDTETTGMDADDDEIIELALVPFEFDKAGNIYRILPAYNGFQDPGIPIPEIITQITGITDDMVKGQSIDLEQVSKMLSEAVIVIAHNARFDRPFVENLLDEDYEDVYGYSTNGIGGFVGARISFSR